MTTDCPDSDHAARDSAIARLHDEHRSIARVLEALETITAEISERLVEPDFTLLATMLYYLDAVPERMHHPKEDRYLFAALARHDPDAASLIARLEREHQRTGDLIGELERALVHWQGGAADGVHQFALVLSTYCDFTWKHMRAEETQILPRARQHLTVADWQALDAAFSANDDPLFGVSRRREFDRLYHRIANLAPRRLKLELLRRE